ncbi:hypothetical protein CJ030_MR4G023643 [Morella rubra]|uniref:Uncharacterized protein n=1 Tax=Morella rubra TaxID=262757 RepID=A0A6A1VVK9_9ROSI|nr:hypothetical protein CJ030_MR4G023643 [Morella rubra]
MSLRVRRQMLRRWSLMLMLIWLLILPFIPSPTRDFDLPSSSDSRFTAFEARMLAMHEAQNKFIQDSLTSMQEEQRQFFAEMRTFMARFPPP